jgi:hypothetical protein
VTIRADLDRSLQETPRLERDFAAVSLARLLADVLDDAQDRMFEAAEEGQALNFKRMADVVHKISPQFRAVLEALWMTPGSRPAAARPPEQPVDPAFAALDQLQAFSEKLTAGTATQTDAEFLTYLDPEVAAILAAE